MTIGSYVNELKRSYPNRLYQNVEDPDTSPTCQSGEWRMLIKAPQPCNPSAAHGVLRLISQPPWTWLVLPLGHPCETSLFSMPQALCIFIRAEHAWPADWGTRRQPMYPGSEPAVRQAYVGFAGFSWAGVTLTTSPTLSTRCVPNVILAQKSHVIGDRPPCVTSASEGPCPTIHHALDIVVPD